MLKKFFPYKLPKSRNKIILHTSSPLIRYAFLQMDIQDVLKRLTITKSHPKQQINHKYYSNLYQLLEKPFIFNSIKKIQQIDFKKQFLVELYNKNPQKQQNLVIKNSSRLQKDIKPLLQQSQIFCLNQVANCYNQLKNEIKNHINRSNFREIVRDINQLNIIHIQVWQRVIKTFQQVYQKFSDIDKDKYLNLLIRYFKKFKKTSQQTYQDDQIQSTKSFKIMYHQTCLRDLADFNLFIKKFIQTKKHQFIENKPKKQQGFNIDLERFQLGNKFYVKKNRHDTHQSRQQHNLNLHRVINCQMTIICKLTKAIDINIFWLRKQFNGQRSNQLIRVITQNNIYSQQKLRFILTYFHFFTLIGINFPYQKLEDTLLEFINQGYLKKNLFKIANQIVSSWKYQGRYNQQIYRLFILKQFRLYINTHHYLALYRSQINNLLLGLLASCQLETQQKKQGIYSLINETILKYQIIGYKDDKYLHLIKHYLKAVNKLQNSIQNILKKQYQQCFHKQNIHILRILKQKNIYSNCLIFHQKQKNQQQQPQKDYNQKLKRIQFNSIQKFWQKCIEQLIPKNYIIHYCQFCQYQIDTMIITNDQQMIALEIQGSHYNQNLGNVQRYNKNSIFGKKKIRQTIISAYHIKILRIKCWAQQQSQLIHSRNYHLGQIYLKQKISQLVIGNFQQLFK